jgi:DNA-binding LytR/AlgR family response regulator
MENFKIQREDLLTIDQRRKKVIAINQIIMMKGVANYTCFYLKNGKHRVTSHTLKYYEPVLIEKGFLRVHRAFMVNQKCILEHDTDNSQLLMENGHQADISRRRKRKIGKDL